jgi:hypothetical protein
MRPYECIRDLRTSALLREFIALQWRPQIALQLNWSCRYWKQGISIYIYLVYRKDTAMSKTISASFNYLLQLMIYPRRTPGTRDNTLQ